MTHPGKALADENRLLLAVVAVGQELQQHCVASIHRIYVLYVAADGSAFVPHDHVVLILQPLIQAIMAWHLCVAWQ